MSNNPIKTFNAWAQANKDLGMEKNHANSVEFMLNKIPSKILYNPFSFLDLGCGNGWVVRKMNKIENCIKSVGIDGAEHMINKANDLSPNLDYFKLDIDNLNFSQKFNIVFSMEVFYYLRDPLNTLKHIYNNLLKDAGFFIMGLDYYTENKASLSWPKDLNLDLKKLSINDWVEMVKLAGFFDVSYEQVGKKENWGGTLIIYANKQKGSKNF